MQIGALVLALFVLNVQPVFAHGVEETPFLQINNKPVLAHPLKEEDIKPQLLSVPEDKAAEPYLVNDEIRFVLDQNALSQQFSDEMLQTMMFQWDFGDGRTARGEDVTHTYSQIGSKVVTITAQFNDSEKSQQLLEQIQLEIVPNKQYKLPDPRIVVNREPLGNTFYTVSLQNPVAFEARLRYQSSAEIVSYVWDFGDGKKSNEQKVLHQYEGAPILATPVVKVTDKNGFTAYAYGLLSNNKTPQGYTFAANTVGVLILLMQGVVVVVGVIWFLLAIRKNKRKKEKM